MELGIKYRGSDTISWHVQYSGLKILYKTSKALPAEREQDCNHPEYYLEALIDAEYLKELLQHG